jgi:hypothetical protein
MKNKELKELLEMFPDDMEVVLHYSSDLYVVYENDFVVDNRELGYCSFPTKWRLKEEVYGKFFTDTYHARTDYKDGQKIYEDIPLTKKDVLVLEVVER